MNAPPRCHCALAMRSFALILTEPMPSKLPSLGESYPFRFRFAPGEQLRAPLIHRYRTVLGGGVLGRWEFTKTTGLKQAFTTLTG